MGETVWNPRGISEKEFLPYFCHRRLTPYGPASNDSPDIVKVNQKLSFLFRLLHKVSGLLSRLHNVLQLTGSSWILDALNPPRLVKPIARHIVNTRCLVMLQPSAAKNHRRSDLPFPLSISWLHISECLDDACLARRHGEIGAHSFPAGVKGGTCVVNVAIHWINCLKLSTSRSPRGDVTKHNINMALAIPQMKSKQPRSTTKQRQWSTPGIYCRCWRCRLRHWHTMMETSTTAARR